MRGAGMLEQNLTPLVRKLDLKAEALSSGVPVIASNIDGLRTVVKDGEVGYLVQPKDVVGIAGNIIEVFTTGGLRAKLSRNARQRAVDESSWAAKAKRITEIDHCSRETIKGLDG